MFAELADIHAFRRGARQQAANLPRVLPDLPLGTYERIPVPPEAGVAELMVYRPDQAATEPVPAPVYVNLHGGGFVIGDWESDDPYCRLLSDTAGCAVVNVDYVLAPEDPFPAAIEQVYTLLNWLHRHAHDFGLDGDRLAVGGHSAGGNLAAAVSLLTVERGEFRLRGQILDYPPLDLVTDPRDKSNPDPDPFMAEFAVRAAEQFNAWYLGDLARAKDPLASPLLAPDLAGLPPALVITAAFDVLRAEGATYAERLAEAGVATEYVSYDQCPHAFTHFGPPAQAEDAWGRMARFLERVLA